MADVLLYPQVIKSLSWQCHPNIVFEVHSRYADLSVVLPDSSTFTIGIQVVLLDDELLPYALSGVSTLTVGLGVVFLDDELVPDPVSGVTTMAPVGWTVEVPSPPFPAEDVSAGGTIFSGTAPWSNEGYPDVVEEPYLSDNSRHAVWQKIYVPYPGQTVFTDGGEDGGTADTVMGLFRGPANATYAELEQIALGDDGNALWPQLYYYSPGGEWLYLAHSGHSSTGSQAMVWSTQGPFDLGVTMLGSASLSVSFTVVGGDTKILSGLDVLGVSRMAPVDLAVTGGIFDLHGILVAGSTSMGVALVVPEPEIPSVIGATVTDYPFAGCSALLPPGSLAGDLALILFSVASYGYNAPAGAVFVMSAGSYDYSIRIYSYVLTDTDIAAGYVVMPNQYSHGAVTLTVFRDVILDLAHTGSVAESWTEPQVTPAAAGFLYHASFARGSGTMTPAVGSQDALSNVVSGGFDYSVASGTEPTNGAPSTARTWTWTNYWDSGSAGDQAAAVLPLSQVVPSTPKNLNGTASGGAQVVGELTLLQVVALSGRASGFAAARATLHGRVVVSSVLLYPVTNTVLPCTQLALQIQCATAASVIQVMVSSASDFSIGRTVALDVPTDSVAPPVVVAQLPFALADATRYYLRLREYVPVFDAWSNWSAVTLVDLDTTSGVGSTPLTWAGVSDTTPDPQLWMLSADFVYAGVDATVLYGTGFGDAQGSVVLDDDTVSLEIQSWVWVPPTDNAYTADRVIDPVSGSCDPGHYEVAVVLNAEDTTDTVISVERAP